MTENEAKTKWCPHARIRFSGQREPACNMDGLRNRVECIALDCAMWQRVVYFCDTDGGPAKWLCDDADEEARIIQHEIKDNNDRELISTGGLCGLKVTK